MKGIKGELSLEHGGRSLRLVFDFNAICALEEETGRGVMDMMADFDGDKMSFIDMRRIVHVSLRRHHPEATVEDAGDILSDDIDVLTRLLEAAFPDAAAEGEAGNRNGGKAA
jgi:hypothetical protein